MTEPQCSPDIVEILRALEGGDRVFSSAYQIACRQAREEIECLRAATQSAPDTAEGFNFYQHLKRQREWSGTTFGPGARTKGVVDHIRKELGEIEADPTDITEWIDVVILALDGAWRAGAWPDQIIATLVAKQTKNEARVWPDWRTADPNKAIEHVKESVSLSSTQQPQDHEPRCDCGHLFEICNAPNCPSAMTSTQRGDEQ